MAIRLGTTNIKNIYLGAVEVLAVYLGNNIVYKSITKYVSDYSARVIADGGTVESLTNVTTIAQNLRNSDLFERLTLLFVPSGVKAGKAYVLIPEDGTGSLTVVRNTTATYFNSSMILVSAAANVARYTYLTVGGNSFLLDEPQRTNLLPQGEALNNGSFFNTNAATISLVSVLNPANSLASFEYRLNNSTGDTQFIRVNPNATYASNVKHTYSIFIKYGSFQFCKLSYINFLGSYTVAVFDLVNGVLGATAASGTGAAFNDSKIKSLQNGWFRISISGTLLSSAGNPMNFEFNKVSSANPTFSNFGRESQTTTTADFCYLDRAQLEVGDLTSYIPTAGSAVTRNADVITRTPPTGTVKIITTFSDDTTQVLTTIPATYTTPEGLIKSIAMNNVL